MAASAVAPVSPQRKSNCVKTRISGLDGLRAASIALVILFHVQFLGELPQGIQRVAVNGGRGVDVFFTISGFLITTLLLQEESRNGSFNLREFYTRRAYRILPPALFFLVCLVILSALFDGNVPALDYVSCLMFLRNLAGGSVSTNHFWSLSVEEQFYIAWPVALLILKTSKNRILLTAALIAIAPFWRQFNYYLAGNIANVNMWRGDLVCDSILFGCLLALLRTNDEWRWLVRHRWMQGIAVPVAGTAIAILLCGVPLPRGVRAFASTAFCASVAVIINYLADYSDGRFGRVMNATPVVWVGKLSYSLYLWQQLFCVPGFLAMAFPLNIAASLGCAAVSYYCVELPALKMRQRRNRITAPQTNPAD